MVVHAHSWRLLTVVAPDAEQYGIFMLDRTELTADPAQQFKNWFLDAQNANIPLAEATTLSTANLPSGRVSSRIVLLKELDMHGNLIIYSNWKTSKKARDIETNPYACLTFFWKELERQVRVEGITELLSTEESQIYFDTRPRGSQIGAWASPQSQVIHRHDLDSLVHDQEARFEGVERIPCPPFWGGLKIKPIEWEFFQGRPNRVHDRFRYAKNANGKWVVDRLAS
jgi:pyridoxamine 5'-phosphate oxidase